MGMPGRKVASENYRYGFNGQEKSTELDQNGNSMTAEFWQYDARLGRRWNVDPRPDVSISQYSSFANNPVIYSDPLGDTIRIYGVAEVLGRTLTDKGGVREKAGAMKGGSFRYRDAKINPVYQADEKTLVGYHVYDVTNDSYRNPVLQLETPADLEEFKKNYGSIFRGAQWFYAFGEPGEGYKKMAAGMESGNKRMIFSGIWQENKEFWSDPGRAIPALLSIGLASGPSRSSTVTRSAFRSRPGKRGYTEVGYQFQKHASRGGSWAEAIPQGVTLNPGTYNQAGRTAFLEIWKSPGSFHKVGKFWEKRLPDGRGIRFQQNWQFKGFID